VLTRQELFQQEHLVYLVLQQRGLSFALLILFLCLLLQFLYLQLQVADHGVVMLIWMILSVC